MLITMQKEALAELIKVCEYEYYGEKHCESLLTKIMQRYYLPLNLESTKKVTLFKYDCIRANDS